MLVREVKINSAYVFYFVHFTNIIPGFISLINMVCIIGLFILDLSLNRLFFTHFDKWVAKYY